MTDCVYCTNEKEMMTFWEEGLKVSKVSTDKFIHFATAVLKEESSTRGAGKKRVADPVFIHLDFDKAVAAGMEFYLQDKEVVTEGTDGVISSDLFKRVYKTLPNGAVVILRPFLRKAKEQC
jgi:RNA:NAD 2'-phosphotransferase (TPT1/KptA family)